MKTVLLSLFQLAASISAGQAAPLLPPARIIPFHETVFGYVNDDPYRWMEDSAQLPALTAWLAAANITTSTYLAALPDREGFAATLTQALQAGVRFSNVTSSGSRLFALRQDPGDRTPHLIVREDGQERVLLDPQHGVGGHVAAIGEYQVSPDGRIAAIQISPGGGEVGSIRFINVATGATIGAPVSPVWDEMPVAWLTPDRVSVVFMATPPSNDPTQNMHVAVLSPGRSEGPDILGPSDGHLPGMEPKEFPSVFKPPISSWAIGSIGGARADGRVLLARADALAAARPNWRTIAGYADQVTGAALRGDELFVLRTLGTPNGRVDRLGAADGTLQTATTVLPASDLVLTEIETATDGLYVAGQRDGISHLLFLAKGEGTAVDIPLPFESSLLEIRADTGGHGVVFGLTGWTEGATFFRAIAGHISPLGLASVTWPGAPVPAVLHPAATSADGTTVPMVVLRPPHASSRIRTILQGYGAYGDGSTMPFYSSITATWLAHGGGFALCGTRGGNERGRAWQEAGRAANKPNAQADFIACARALDKAGLSSPALIVATGTSAGGALVPPAVIRQPALFAGLLSRVGIVNSTRLAAAENGPNQYNEFGDPRTPSGFAALRQEDAYDMLANASDLPATLITVGLNDKRVAPWMGAKFAARASARFAARRLILLRADTEAGHGIGSARDRVIQEWADALAFASAVTGK